MCTLPLFDQFCLTSISAEDVIETPGGTGCFPGVLEDNTGPLVHLDFRWDKNGVDGMVRIGKCLLNRDRGEVSFLFRRGYRLKFKDNNGFWFDGPVTRDLF